MGRGTFLFAGGLLALLAAFAFKHVLIAIPEVPAVAAAGTFDTNRAFARLERVLAGEIPHPIDSPASDGVRERLLAEMRSVGLEPRVTDTMTCSSFRRSRSVNCARVRNLIATIGPAEGEHLLLVAHYDSVPVGPGAADAGIGVATLLEVAEQLRGRALARPVTFLFNEGEESGLLGARAFLDHDPAAPRVSHLVNLEARGVAGPAIMFETSRPNGPAIALYRAAVERPVANSLSTDFYRLLPNSTDVAVFEERPWTILNIAIIGNETRYHTAGDDLAALDRRSLQHMGRQALQIAQTYVGGEWPQGAGEVIYADVLTRHLVVVPLVPGLILLGVVVLVLGAVVVRRRAYGSALIACLAAVAGTALLAFLLTSIVQQLRPGEFWRAWPIAMQVASAATALLAIAIALSLFRRATREQLRAAAWFLYAASGAAACFVAPGAAIYFLYAPAIVIGGIALQRWRAGAERIAGWIASIVQLLTLLPVLALIDLLLSTSSGWIAAPLAASAALPLLVELRPEGGPGRSGLLAAAGLALATWAAVLIVPAYSEDRQQIFTVEHVRNTATGAAQWAIYNDGTPLPEAYAHWGPWERNTVPYARRPRWIAEAPGDPSPGPQLVRTGERPVEGGRLVGLRLTLNGWDGAVLQAPAAAQLRAMRSGDMVRPFNDGTNDFTIRCSGRSCDGFTFELLVGSDAPVEAVLVGNAARLPAAADPLVQARPVNARPQYVPDASYTLTPVRF